MIPSCFSLQVKIKKDIVYAFWFKIIFKTIILACTNTKATFLLHNLERQSSDFCKLTDSFLMGKQKCVRFHIVIINICNED